MKEVRDRYFRKAKEEQYLARSVYKLSEALEKFSFIRPADRVLDVGCAPGSWSQFLTRSVITTGSVTGIDILPVQFSHPHFTFIQGDIKTIDAASLVRGGLFSAVISDAMANTIADPEANHYRSINLCRVITRALPALLSRGGHFFIKVFDGPDLTAYRTELKAMFATVANFKPKSSREESRELFLCCRAFHT
ncbi:MAG: RlmE family RNA methyltransferase [Spirochaetota bacterium]